MSMTAVGEAPASAHLACFGSAQRSSGAGCVGIHERMGLGVSHNNEWRDSQLGVSWREHEWLSQEGHIVSFPSHVLVQSLGGKVDHCQLGLDQFT